MMAWTDIELFEKVKNLIKGLLNVLYNGSQI